MAESNQEKRTFPIQRSTLLPRDQAVVPEDVYMAAYEVYCHVYGPQEAMITGWCRGGFGIGELVAFLYAKSFPKELWRHKVDEAFEGMKV